MHAARAGTAPLFASGTRFDGADVAKGSSLQAMHAARAWPHAPLFAGDTRFGCADVAKGSSLQARRRGFAGGGRGYRAELGSSRRKKENLKSGLSH
jgi:hypothetical protein